MTIKEKELLNLLTDKTWIKLCNNGVLQTENEKHGAMIMITHLFNQAIKIIEV